MSRIYKFVTESGTMHTEVHATRRKLQKAHQWDADAINNETIIDYTPYVMTAEMKERIARILSTNNIDQLLIKALLD